MVDIYTKKTIPAEQKKLKTKKMYWSHKTDLRKQIFVSSHDFSDDNCKDIHLSLDDLSSETCPIPLEEFENYMGIPRGIAEEDFDKLKIFFRSRDANYICFIGITQKAVQNA